MFRRKRRDPEPEPEVIEIEIPADQWQGAVLKEAYAAYGEDDPRTIGAAIELARMFSQNSAKRADAFQLYMWVLPVLWQTRGPDDPEVLQIVHEAADLAHTTGQTARAEQMLQDVLEHRERVLGPSHPDTITTARALANVLSALGRAAEAEALLHDVNDRRSTWEDRAALARTLLAGGQRDKALELFRALAAEAERTHGDGDPTTALARTNLAAALFGVGELDQAERLFRDVLRALGPDQEVGLRAFVHNNLGTVLFFKSDFRQAEDELRKALAIRERGFGPLHPDTVATVENLARVLAERGEHREAITLARRCLDVYTTSLPASHPKIANVRQLLADLGADR
ncbi:tetratricopeptide repeat protein [Saccharothrix carnea]|uniref:Tetratricopeptide repeat protein n=1 Tax=Saccharothrix carnea TaxID=1280637 RepID=A0A2P8H9W3_SACCR|nr:tetratricopeptide repeat protein [Saccharothrix carnea]PSL43004.1 tetratricopeptide repeat protein [Saccharothrix carnea]